MIYKCAWCGGPLPKTGEFSGSTTFGSGNSSLDAEPVSHGICERCFLLEMQKNGLISKAEKIRLEEIEKTKGASYGI